MNRAPLTLFATACLCACSQSRVLETESGLAPCEPLLEARQSPPLVADTVFEPPLPFENPLLDAFTKVVFHDAHFYFVRKEGTVYRINASLDPESWQEVLDLSDEVRNDFEDGLYALAFHPDFDENGFAFVVYNFRDEVGRNLRVSRLQSSDGGASFERDSLTVFLETESRAEDASSHNGGDLHFGPDGYLYVSFGDGNASLDPETTAQDLTNLLGSLIRIDVDEPGEDTRYSIPEDNPFRGDASAREEIWAYGLRNPFRFSIDPDTASVWVGDVGQISFEEVNVVQAGKNYGWPLREGPLCISEGGQEACDAVQTEPPLFSYGRGTGNSITGGFVYRGNTLSGLEGHYVFADFQVPSIWILRSPYEAPALERGTDTLDIMPVSLVGDADGNIYAMGLSGTLVRLRENTESAAVPRPELLSQTGCMDRRQGSEPLSAFVPYETRSQLWSDDADKRRFLYLPSETQMQLLDGQEFFLPTGSIAIKEFSRGERLLETRFLIHDAASGWQAFSYAWNEDQTDAVLREDGAEIALPDGESWQVPSVNECFRCHTSVANRSLGLELGQIRGHEGAAFDAFASQGWVPFGSDGLAYPELPGLDEVEASLESRARSYLHANCSFCHRPGGPGRGELDLRVGTDFADTGLCDVPPSLENFGSASNRLIKPGDPDASVLLLRMQATGELRMPPLATSQVDAAAVEVVAAWISSIESCP